ncbi:type IV secretion system protein [Kribbella sp. NPDC059898]|uniref:type IV secretion system protein n=1 Tax=Kribbella sp. NPDC059898 TaxID=3346995 RepID=UPI0036688CBD
MIALCSWYPGDWPDCVKKYVGQAISWFVNLVFGKIFDAVRDIVLGAVASVIKAVGFAWIYLSTPNVDANGPASWVQAHTYFIVVAVGAIAVIVGAMQMAYMHRGEPLRDILKSLLTLLVVSAGGSAFAATLIGASDQFSRWIMNSALLPTKAECEGEKLDKLTGAAKEAAMHVCSDAAVSKLTAVLIDPLKGPQEIFGFILVIFIGILMVITAIIQLALMIVRYGMLVLLVGVLPLTAAATNTEMGMMWFKRTLGWLVGFIIYKPVAALIYATAILLIGGAPTVKGAEAGTSETLNMVMGVTLMVVAVVALPAILRFVSPKPS